MIRASIDLGTNTCLLLIAEWDAQNRQVSRILHDQCTVVRLGEGVDRNRQLASAAKNRTLACLETYAAKVTEFGLKPADVFCVATSQARDARDGMEFFTEVQTKSGFKFRTISGDDEARFTFLGGLLPGLSPESSVVVDIGGGSTEFTGLFGGQSLDIGSVRFTERYLKSNPVTDDEFWACQEELDRLIESLKEWRKSLPLTVRLVAVAGTATTLASIHLGLSRYDASRIDGQVLSRGDIHRLVEELKFRTYEERARLPGMEKGREDVLLAGALILWRSMEILDFPDCVVSTRGLRFGVFQMFPK